MTKDKDALLVEVVDLIVDSLNLHFVDKSEIRPDTQLAGEGLGLDSIDILEIVVGVEKRYNVKIQSAEEGKKVFATVGSILDFIGENRGVSGDLVQPQL